MNEDIDVDVTDEALDAAVGAGDTDSFTVTVSDGYGGAMTSPVEEGILKDLGYSVPSPE